MGRRRSPPRRSPYTIHDSNQLVVGIIAERPQDLVSAIDLLPNQNQVVPVVLPLEVANLPDRVEAWQAFDRLVWQDVDSGTLSTAQLAALRNWVAAGGRLVIVGGSTGPGALAAFPDDLLPFRPAATMDVPAASLTGLLGPGPGRAPGPARPERRPHRRPVAGGRRATGSSPPSGPSAAASSPSSASTRPRTGSPTPRSRTRSGAASSRSARRQGLNLTSDGDLVNAVAQLPALALPPVGGLFAILGLYILLVGPINYLVLRRLGHREWAWATIPALIAIFAIGAYGFGASLRGSSVIVNEVALVRGAPGTTDGMAQVYVGVFSPTRGTYQMRFPSGALLSPPIIGDTFGGEPDRPWRSTSSRASRRRCATSRSGSAPSGPSGPRRPSAVPLVQADLAPGGRPPPRDGHQRLRTGPRYAGRSSWARRSPACPTCRPASRRTSMSPSARTRNPFGQAIAELIVGQPQYDANGRDLDTERYARYAMINQLTYDTNTGMNTQLPTDGAVILAWSRGRGAPGRDRRRVAPPDRHDALLPADPRRDQRPHDLHFGPPAIHGRGRRRDVLRQGGRQHELRRRAASRSPIDRSRSKDRSRPIA